MLLPFIHLIEVFMWQDDDNLAELAISTRDFVTCGPCQPHEAATNHQHFFNWNKFFGII